MVAGWRGGSVRRGVCCGVQTRSVASGGRGLAGVGLARWDESNMWSFDR
jgi:hypothetical protein